MLSFPFIALLVAPLKLVSAQNASVITSDTYFYGESPEVAPVAGTGAGNWSSAYDKAKVLLAKLSLDEKINLTAGITPENGCAG